MCCNWRRHRNRTYDHSSVPPHLTSTEHRLVANGAKVYILGRRKDTLEAAAKHYGQNNQIIPVECDVTSKQSIESAVKTISQNEAHIHLLVNNSGIAGPKSATEASSASRLKEDLFEFSEWDDVYRTSISALYFTALAFLPLLKKATESEKGFSASIINVTSISGLTKASQNHFCYNSSKAGAIHLTRLLATELVSGIRDQGSESRLSNVFVSTRSHRVSSVCLFLNDVDCSIRDDDG